MLLDVSSTEESILKMQTSFVNYSTTTDQVRGKYKKLDAEWHGAWLILLD